MKGRVILAALQVALLQYKTACSAISVPTAGSSAIRSARKAEIKFVDPSAVFNPVAAEIDSVLFNQGQAACTKLKEHNAKSLRDNAEATLIYLGMVLVMLIVSNLSEGRPVLQVDWTSVEAGVFIYCFVFRMISLIVETLALRYFESTPELALWYTERNPELFSESSDGNDTKN